MWSTAVLALVLSFLLSTTTASALATNVTLLLNDCCGPIQSYFLRTLSLPDPTHNLSLHLNVTTADPQSTTVYTQRWNMPGDSNVDMITADPTLANPTFLTAHGDYTYIQYIQSPLNATVPSSYRPNPAPHLSNMMPYPQSDVPGVGLYYVELHFLFYLEVTAQYYSIAYIDVEGPTRTVFDFMVFSSPDAYSGGSTGARPTYTDTRTVPADSYPGLSGSKVAINQEKGQVYVNIVFWQASEPQYQTGWLWTFDPRKNAIVSEITYPTNTTGYLDYKTELTYSAKRQQLYGATFPSNSLLLDRIDPINGTVVRISSHSGGVVMDDYDSCQALDDESGWWYFASNDYYVVPPNGLPWLLYSVHVETGVMGPSHLMIAPYYLLGISFIPPSALRAVTEAGGAEQVVVDEKETAAHRQRMKRFESKNRSRKVATAVVAQQ